MGLSYVILTPALLKHWWRPIEKSGYGISKDEECSTIFDEETQREIVKTAVFVRNDEKLVATVCETSEEFGLNFGATDHLTNDHIVRIFYASGTPGIPALTLGSSSFFSNPKRPKFYKTFDQLYIVKLSEQEQILADIAEFFASSYTKISEGHAPDSVALIGDHMELFAGIGIDAENDKFVGYIAFQLYGRRSRSKDYAVKMRFLQCIIPEDAVLR